MFQILVSSEINKEYELKAPTLLYKNATFSVNSNIIGRNKKNYCPK